MKTGVYKIVVFGHEAMGFETGILEPLLNPYGLIICAGLDSWQFFATSWSGKSAITPCYKEVFQMF